MKTDMDNDCVPTRLDLGAGVVSPPGFIPLGNVNGTKIFPLPYPDNSIAEIRASHCLEHFAHKEVPEVLADWVRVLKPGGTLRIAVPDFGKIAVGYVEGQNQNTQGYVMGGQTDAADFHKVLFDRSTLSKMLAGAGMMLIRDWTSELADCAALPVSLNLSGVKPHQAAIGVHAIMSVPRLGFMDNFFCSFEALPQLNIQMRRYTGAFWSQCIERVFEQTLDEDNPDAILTLDYDTVFARRDASMLLQLMCCYPEADAIATVQSGRGKIGPLFTIKGDGVNIAAAPRDHFAGDLTRVATAHFGLTLLRADKIRKLRKPWFQDLPAPDGSWNEGHTDADITFWRKWEEAGNNLFIANRVPVGHLDLSVRWPGQNLAAIHQPIEDWRADGPPKEIWK